MPLRYRGVDASFAARGTYFSRPCARILYGSENQHSRWHNLSTDPAANRDVFAVELLVPDPTGQPDTALALFHIRSDQTTILNLLRGVAGRRDVAAQTPDLAAAIRPFATLRSETRPFTVAFFTTGEPRLPPPPGGGHVRPWTRAEHWLWQLASRTSHADYPPDPDYADRLTTGAVVLSADWRGLVTRDGAAFVGLRQDDGDADPFLGYAQLYTHTVYLDALLLGMIQRSHIETMIDASARALEAKDLPRHLNRLEDRAARFRSIYWLRDASDHGPANDILTVYQEQHRLPDRFDAVLGEIADMNRIVQTQEGQRVGAALGVLTVIGLPVGAMFGVLQALGTTSPRALVVGVLVVLATTAALLMTRLGRLLVRELRRLT